MAEKMTIDSKDSEARVAYELMHEVIRWDTRSEWKKDDILNLYAECLSAARGFRDFKKALS